MWPPTLPPLAPLVVPWVDPLVALVLVLPPAVIAMKLCELVRFDSSRNCVVPATERTIVYDVAGTPEAVYDVCQVHGAEILERTTIEPAVDAGAIAVPVVRADRRALPAEDAVPAAAGANSDVETLGEG